jgi:hypothetical protein
LMGKKYNDKKIINHIQKTFILLKCGNLKF